MGARLAGMGMVVGKGMDEKAASRQDASSKIRSASPSHLTYLPLPLPTLGTALGKAELKLCDPKKFRFVSFLTMGFVSLFLNLSVSISISLVLVVGARGSGLCVFPSYSCCFLSSFSTCARSVSQKREMSWKEGLFYDHP